MNEPFQAVSTKPKTVLNAADATRIAPATAATVRRAARAPLPFLPTPPLFSLPLNLVAHTPRRSLMYLGSSKESPIFSRRWRTCTVMEPEPFS